MPLLPPLLPDRLCDGEYLFPRPQVGDPPASVLIVYTPITHPQNNHLPIPTPPGDPPASDLIIYAFILRSRLIPHPLTPHLLIPHPFKPHPFIPHPFKPHPLIPHLLPFLPSLHTPRNEGVGCMLLTILSHYLARHLRLVEEEYAEKER